MSGWILSNPGKFALGVVLLGIAIGTGIAYAIDPFWAPLSGLGGCLVGITVANTCLGTRSNRGVIRDEFGRDSRDRWT